MHIFDCCKISLPFNTFIITIAGLIILVLPNIKKIKIWRRILNVEIFFREGSMKHFFIILGIVLIIFGGTLTAIESFKNTLLIEDFEDTTYEFNWWTFDSTIINYKQTNEKAKCGDHSFKISFKKSDTYQFVGANIIDRSKRNLASHNVISFWVYGSVSLLIKFEDSNKVGLDIGTLKSTKADDWSKLTFKFDPSSKGDINFANIENIMIFIEPGDSTAHGTIFIDDIKIQKE